ncbi:hypothetical protein CTI12_AA286570 [Artemisia annua]|uniref:Uncharacterized protein n=1 Tax=Artemisia annua TaxID=35608 RepID=A0A2U1NA95_ARTAN|nr:hypothetical protein CTI12_AA286570 [Artemisia annua]
MNSKKSTTNAVGAVKIVDECSPTDKPRDGVNISVEYEWDDTNGKVDIFVMGIGSGGIVSGVGGCLKSTNLDVKHNWSSGTDDISTASYFG